MARKIRVATISLAYELRKASNRQDNYEYMRKCFAEIAPLKPDLVCLPEVWPMYGLAEHIAPCPEDMTVMRELARKHRTYVVGSIHEKRKNGLYNTAPIIGRDGKILGRYDKIHPVETELEMGIVSGRKDQRPVKTDIGTIGVQICFDVNWPQESEFLADQGTEILVFSSAFPAGTILTALATLYQYYIIPAIWTYDSGIIDNTGRWIAKTDRLMWWVCREINLDRTVFHWDFQDHRLKDIRKKYGNKVKIEVFGPEGWFVLEPEGDLSIETVKKEFGLVTYREYIKRATGKQDKARP